MKYHRQQNKCNPKCAYLPISKLHSILAVANLLAHNNKSWIYYCGQTFITAWQFFWQSEKFGGNIYFACDCTRSQLNWRTSEVTIAGEWIRRRMSDRKIIYFAGDGRYMGSLHYPFTWVQFGGVFTLCCLHYVFRRFFLYITYSMYTYIQCFSQIGLAWKFTAFAGKVSYTIL